MLLNWFNAREAVAVGATLADHFRPREISSTASGSGPKDWRKDVQRFRQRIAHEARPLKLNLFKRAKLLNSFKWRLLEHGFDRGTADELTQVLLMQLCTKGIEWTTPAGEAPRHKGPSSKRLSMLLAEADKRFADGEYAEAVERLEEALALDSRNADVHAKRGLALCCVGRYAEAEEALRRATAIKPHCGAAHLTLGILLRDRGEFAASETALRRAVKRDPRSHHALASLGLTLGMLNRLSEARGCLEKARRLKPQDPEVLCFCGWLEAIEGRFDEAERLYRATLNADPLHPGAWALLAGLRRMTDADHDWLTGAERTLARGLPPLEESKLRYAVGKYFDDLGKYSRAFEQYKRANDLRRQAAVPYDHVNRTKFVDQTIALYTRQRLAQPVEDASESARAVFVTGMMRSGTSLVEQIIASHPHAAGAGELDFWSVAARKRPDELHVRNLGESYLKVLEQHSPHAERVVDKSTFNTDHLGLIHVALPQARFVYVQRDPVDNCLSCYFQDFANVASFTMDLADLAHYYREHHRLISHWRSTLPQGVLLVVPYQELVADPEGWSRRIVEFIGLEWDSRCLEFHKTQRSVLTASNWQVRQPIYSRSIGRWRNYEKFIRPLLGLRDLAPV